MKSVTINTTLLMKSVTVKHMKSVSVGTTLLKSITVLHKTDFTPMGHYQLNLIQITYYRKTWPQSIFRQCRYIIQHYLRHSNMHALG